MMRRNWFSNIHSGLIAGAFIPTAPIMVAVAAFTVAGPAFARSSLNSSSTPATYYALPPPEEGSLAVPATPIEETPDDLVPDDPTRSDATANAAVPTDSSAAVNPVAVFDDSSTSAVAHSGWDRVGDVYTDDEGGDQVDQVLEVPEVLQPDSPQPADGSEPTAQETASQSPDQVGSIDDYQGEDEAALIGGYGVPVLIGRVPVSSFAASSFQSPFNPRFAPGFVPKIRPAFAGRMHSQSSPIFPRGPMRFSGGMRRGRR